MYTYIHRSTHDLWTQHLTHSRRFLLLSASGIILLQRRQPWEKLEFACKSLGMLQALRGMQSQDQLFRYQLRFPKEQVYMYVHVFMCVFIYYVWHEEPGSAVQISAEISEGAGIYVCVCICMYMYILCTFSMQSQDQLFRYQLRFPKEQVYIHTHTHIVCMFSLAYQLFRYQLRICLVS